MSLQDFVLYWEYNIPAVTQTLTIQVSAFPATIAEAMYIGHAEFSEIDNIFTRYTDSSFVLPVTTDSNDMTTTI